MNGKWLQTRESQSEPTVGEFHSSDSQCRSLQLHRNWRYQALLTVGGTENGENRRMSSKPVLVVRPPRPAPPHPTEKNDYIFSFLQKPRSLEKWNQRESGLRNIRHSCGHGYWMENKGLTENIHTCDIITNISSFCSLFLAYSFKNHWNSSQDCFCYLQQAPFDHTWVYANEVIHRGPLVSREMLVGHSYLRNETPVKNSGQGLGEASWLMNLSTYQEGGTSWLHEDRISCAWDPPRPCPLYLFI